MSTTVFGLLPSVKSFLVRERSPIRLTASLASLIIAGLIDADRDQEGHSVSMPWQRTDKETLFSELASHLAPAA